MSSLQEAIAKGVAEAFKLLSDEDIKRLIIAPYLELQDEAKDKEKLKAEALELVNAWRESGNCTLLTNWDTLNGTSVGDHWLAVARKSRELTKEN